MAPWLATETRGRHGGEVGKRGAGDMVGREEDSLIQMKLHAGLASDPSPPESNGEGVNGAS